MNECILPATGGGLVIASTIVAVLLVGVGAAAVAWSGRGRWLLAAVLVGTAGLIGADRAQASAAPCAPPTVAPADSVTPADPLAPSTTVAPPTTVAAEAPMSVAVSASDTAPQAGASIVVTGSGFPPASTVSIVLFSDPVILGTPTSDAAGSFASTVTIPPGTTAGQHTLTVTGGSASASIALVVTGRAEPAITTTTVPSTTTTPAPTTTTTPAPTTTATTATTTTTSPTTPTTPTTEEGRAPMAQYDKPVAVERGAVATGSLLAGDDPGSPPATPTSLRDIGAWNANVDWQIELGVEHRLHVLQWQVWGDSAPGPDTCGMLTVAASGEYNLSAVDWADGVIWCRVEYVLENDFGTATGAVLFHIGGAAPVATDKQVTVVYGGSIQGNLLDGDDLGDPGAGIDDLYTREQSLSFDTATVMTNDSATGPDDQACGTVTVASDGTYTFTAADAGTQTATATCTLRYVLSGFEASESTGSVTFIVEPAMDLQATTPTVEESTEGPAVLTIVGPPVGTTQESTTQTTDEPTPESTEEPAPPSTDEPATPSTVDDAPLESIPPSTADPAPPSTEDHTPSSSDPAGG